MPMFVRTACLCLAASLLVCAPASASGPAVGIPAAGLDVPGPPLMMSINQASSRCLSVASYPTSFTSSTSWTTLVARTNPFQSCSVTTEYHNGDAFKVNRQTDLGQKICLHPSLHSGPASTVWYHTDRGWIWSGGTSRIVWNTTC